MEPASNFLLALIVHLIADWFLQSDWMATYKLSLRHPAAWVHSGIHTLGLMLVFPVWVAIALGLSHLLIDTRQPLIWIRRVMSQGSMGEKSEAFEIWQDQAAHITLLAVAALLNTR